MSLIEAPVKGKPGVKRALNVKVEGPRPDVFVLLVCDGMNVTEAYRRAGYEAKSLEDPQRLWETAQVQDAVRAIGEARARTGAVSLADVTDMLRRVFAAAMHASDLGAAHNAAFSLARLYGHVIDRTQITDLRKPSRDPDAPSEVALEAWVGSLPALTGPATENPKAQGPGLDSGSQIPPNGPSGFPQGPGPEGSGAKPLITLNNSGLAGPAMVVEHRPGEIENGAPSAAVTGTPDTGALSGPYIGARADFDLGPDEPGLPPPIEKRVPHRLKQVPVRRGIKGKKEIRRGTKTGVLKTPPRLPNGARRPKIPTFRELFD